MTTGLTPYYNSLRAAGLIDAHYAFRSGVCYDIIGNRTITMGAGCLLQRNGAQTPLGASMVSSNLHLQGATEGTVMCLATPIYGNDATYRQLLGDMNTGVTAGFQIQLNASGTLAARIATSGGSKSATGGAGTGATYGQKNWYSFSFKNNNSLTLFKDGVQQGVPTSLAGLTYTQSTASGIYWGQIQGGTRYLSALYHCTIVVKSALTEAQQQTLIDELDNQIRYEQQSMIVNHLFPTLGGDVYRGLYGILAGEVTMSAGQSIGQLDALKVSTGTHRMNTFRYNGQLAKGIKCVTAGNIVLPDPRPTLGTTWAYRYYDDSAAAWSDRTSATATVALDAANDIILWCTADGNVAVRKY